MSLDTFSVVVEAVSAALVPVIAGVVAWIAYAQWRTNELRRRHELHDDRMALYRATADFLSTVCERGDVRLEDYDRLIKEKVRSQFLYRSDVHSYVEHIMDQASVLQSKNRKLESRDPLSADDLDDRQRLNAERDTVWGWLSEERLQLPEGPFKRYLEIP
ncbi:hypothetical protein SR882_10225 [Guyparkeria halophila]|uniref:DUF4760 domain-containing protein n=1 Tax=Guyparkeria halophila TaxID=47960 RepID=A0ABZ0YVC4_9GAMM|nr:hypothetical protein [Guyparkeria halophila]WQH16126.1 hypothetical protein SR882_10225 [Guyparkeria halophila]